MAKPSIITIILFNFLGFWNEYIISFTLMNKQELRTLPVGLMNLMAAQNAAQLLNRASPATLRPVSRFSACVAGTVEIGQRHGRHQHHLILRQIF